LTQEYIAQMLGVRRTSVTVVARTLQEAGIRYSRDRGWRN
jgi:biotin operon repressor